jgi:hypothetical protein
MACGANNVYLSKGENKMKYIKIAHLVGQDLSGLTFDIRTREKKNVLYPDLYPNPLVCQGEFLKVCFKKEDGIKWLYWDWSKSPFRDTYKKGFSCYYSGVAGRRIKSYQIAIISNERG